MQHRLLLLAWLAPVPQLERAKKKPVTGVPLPAAGRLMPPLTYVRPGLASLSPFASCAGTTTKRREGSVPCRGPITTGGYRGEAATSRLQIGRTVFHRDSDALVL